MKVANLNVHALSGNRIDRLIKEVIEPNKLDVLFLQEIHYGTIKLLAKKLGWKFYHCYYCGIISKNSIDVVSEKFQVGRSFARSVFRAKIPVNGKKKTFVMTHLDHISELTRMKQLQLIKNYYKDADFFLGDFNALNPGDYQEKDWKDIVSVRNKLKLEVTKPFVIEQIKSCGFSINPYLGPTTPYNTRVDYFCYKDKFGGDFFMIDTMGPKISDHNMIGIKF